jgi:sugar phosphate isomerase/epimerase
MRTLLNTIAVEPNRWTRERIPAYDLARDIVPRAAAAGFRRLEVWQYHLSHRSMDEAKAVREAGAKHGVTFPVVGCYPAFHLEGPEAEAARREACGLADRAALLGARWLKFFFGRIKGSDLTPRQLELTTARVQEWTAYGRAKELGFCAELHHSTLFDPCDYGLQYLAQHPELGIRICFQPCGGLDAAACVRLIGELGAQIVHAHFSGQNAAGRCALQDASLDWRAVVAALQAANPEFLPSVEFVPHSFPAPGQPFDFDAALADAAADARFLDGLLG